MQTYLTGLLFGFDYRSEMRFISLSTCICQSGYHLSSLCQNYGTGIIYIQSVTSVIESTTMNTLYTYMLRYTAMRRYISVQY